MVIVFFAVSLIASWPRLVRSQRELPLAPHFLIPYAGCLVGIVVTYGHLSRTSFWSTWAVGAWLAAIMLSAVFLLLVLFPPRHARSLLREARSALMLASAAALLSIAFLRLADLLWNAPAGQIASVLQRSTFRIVAATLRILHPSIISSPETFTLSLPNLDATIATACSGVEGLTMMLLFSGGWLWYARRSLRFPQALLLVPASLVLIWILNLGRIVGLMLIAIAGHPNVAVNGFHSEAGWIAFNMVAIGILLASTRIMWFLKRPQEAASTAESNANPVAAYLAPFLAILGASLVSKAMSSGFEWAYALRLFAAAGALWAFRRHFRRESFGSWAAGLVGLAIGALWIGWGYAFPAVEPSPLGSSLQQLPATWRVVWILLRALAATVTVPIAEELAFRGYLMRRLAHVDFENTPYRHVPIYALALSSLAFGAMHGRFWIPGVIAGVAYGWLVRQKNSLGDGICAHAISNACIAAWVLARGQWSLW